MRSSRILIARRHLAMLWLAGVLLSGLQLKAQPANGIKALVSNAIITYQQVEQSAA